ncbi:MAG: flavin reductase, partial [Planctomycetota bacterium]
VNVPPADRKDLAEFCGGVSGRDCDKLAQLKLTPLRSRHISSPGIAECPIVFECNVVHRNEVLPPELPEEIKTRYYPADNFHRVYFGQILGVSVEREFLESLR